MAKEALPVRNFDNSFLKAKTLFSILSDVSKITSFMIPPLLSDQLLDQDL
jgi:hypothetical protein